MRIHSNVFSTNVFSIKVLSNIVLFLGLLTFAQAGLFAQSENPTCGDPGINFNNVDRGTFVYFDCANPQQYHIRTTAGGTSQIHGWMAYEGKITTTGAFRDVFPFDIETNFSDEVFSPSPDEINFKLHVSSRQIDGLDFMHQQNANTCLEVDSLFAQMPVFLGATRARVGRKFNIKTGQGCQDDPSDPGGDLPPDCNGDFDQITFDGQKFSIVCNKHSSLGTNIAAVSESSTSAPFTDLFRSAEPFDIIRDNDPQNNYQPQEASYHSQSRRWVGDYKFDKDGWPIYVAPGFKAVSLVTALAPERGALPDGEFHVFSDGDSGELEYHPQSGLDVDRRNDRDVITFHRRAEDTDGQDRLIIKIKPDLSRTNDPQGNVDIKNIRVIMPGGVCKSNPLQHVSGANDCPSGEFMSYQAHHQGALRFNPAFLDYVKDFKVLRFADMMEINSSPIKDWNHQARVTDASWNSVCSNILKPCEGETGRHATPVEIMVDLANTVNAEPWFMIPHQASNAYIRRFADTVKFNLRPNLKVHLEYSNETWNTALNFEQGRYVIDQGCQRWPELCPGSIENAAMQFHVDRSKEVNQIWQSVLGQRVVRVLARHFRRPDRSSSALDYAGFGQFDSLSVAPYFDISEPHHRDTENFIEPLNLDQVFNRIVLDRVEWEPIVDAHLEIATRYGMALTAYESGHHLTIFDRGGPSRDNLRRLFQRANRDPRMGDEYTFRNNAWRCKTDNNLNVMFTAPSSYLLGFGGNFWGVKEYVLQDRSTATKYDSIRNFIDLHPSNVPNTDCPN